MRAHASSDPRHAALERELYAAAARERTDTADFLRLIAEFDALRLYAPAGYSSMHAFCVGELHMCEESAYKRIQSARAARRFPQLLAALAEGRLHLSAVFLLAPHLTPENVDELVTSATHKTIRAIRDLITRRLVGPEPSLGLMARPGAVVAIEGADSGAVRSTPQLETFPVRPKPSKVGQSLVAQWVDPTLRADVHCTVDRQRLDQARALLSHCIPSGDLGQVFDRALAAVIREEEKRKFASTTRPRGRGARRSSTNERHIPAHLRREVWAHDGGRCTFVGANGHRCGERRFLEFDHVRPVALGGDATVTAADLRLRCRAHNQFEAERVFGTGFMARKREAARRARLGAGEARAHAREKERAHDDRVRAIASGLRNLGCRADEARHAAETAVAVSGPEATLEECLRSALRAPGPPWNTRRDVTTASRAAVPRPIEPPQEAVLV